MYPGIIGALFRRSLLVLSAVAVMLFISMCGMCDEDDDDEEDEDDDFTGDPCEGALDCGPIEE